MKFKLAFLMGLLLGAPSFLLSIELNDENRTDSYLFCIKKEIPVLSIERDAAGSFVSVSNSEIQRYISNNNIIDIQEWMPNANENDFDGDIYLNRIYRAVINQNRERELVSIISRMFFLSSVLYSEPENIHKILYTPNDSNIGNQCSLFSVNAYQAWDFWDIENGSHPGDDNQYVLLASVDTGVDYTHPDLQNNTWINQGEIPSWTFEAGLDLNGDDFIEAEELIFFIETQGMDFNNDGEYNLRDVVYEDEYVNSPFLDGIDGDSNSYTDDILGWDCSGYYGNSNASDPDPYPKEDVANTSTWAHGTHVAGILAATTDNAMGMASTSYNAKFISVKASKDNQSDTDPGINHGYQGILYAAKAGHEDLNSNGTWDPGESFAIINNSWGGGGYSGSENSTINTAHNTYGAIIVAAAGNGSDSGGDEYAAHYPSSYDNCISVCAMGCSGQWGNWATYHPTIDLAAPGESIFSAIIGSGYESWDGSSMASPNAASVIGLVSSYYPDFNNIQLRMRVESTADDVIYELNPEFADCDGSSGENCLGSGMVDAYKAIGLAFSPSIVFSSFNTNLIDGDGDDVLNPGESAELIVEIQNEDGWTDAADVSTILSCDNPAVQIINNSASFSDIPNGEFSSNESNPFSFSTDYEVELGNINFELQVTATGLDDYSYQNSISFDVPVTLYQSGFPFSTGFEVKSSPLVVDINNDGSLELIFGDKSGVVHIVSSDGTEWEDDFFPFSVGDEIWGSLAYADIDLDGFNEIIVPSKNNHLYAIDINGLDFDVDLGQMLFATPSIGNLDDDAELEVVISGYTSSGDIFIVNHDGLFSTIEINEKALGGVSLADFNDDGQDEIIIATENDDMICMVTSSTSSIDTLFIAGNKFKTSPSVFDVNGEKMIMAGSYDNLFYAISPQGESIFSVETGDDIDSSPSFLHDLTFFGSDDGFLYAVETDGSFPTGWPVNLGADVGTASFSDLDGDGSPEIIVGAGNKIYALNLDGSYFNSTHFPVQTEFSVTSAPVISDIDNDNDLELILGTSSNVVVIDISNSGGTNLSYWSMDRGNNERTGLFEAIIIDDECSETTLGDVNADLNIDIFDIILVVNFVLGESTPNTLEECSSDINQDQNIDVFDIISIVNLILE